MNFSQAALNATLNGTSGILLAAGYAAIRAGKREAHKRFMISAFVVSSIFLASYLVYHYPRRPCAVSRAGMDSAGVFCAADVAHDPGHRDCADDFDYAAARLDRKFDKHRAIAKWTLPLWFYVCITGVIVYWMVYQMYGPVHV